MNQVAKDTKKAECKEANPDKNNFFFLVRTKQDVRCRTQSLLAASLSREKLNSFPSLSREPPLLGVISGTLIG